jgi:hypothetical protein
VVVTVLPHAPKSATPYVSSIRAQRRLGRPAGAFIPHRLESVGLSLGLSVSYFLARINTTFRNSTLTVCRPSSITAYAFRDMTVAITYGRASFVF